MKGYKFYSKSDTKKETIGTWVAKDIESAYEGFAQMKKLPVSVFKELFIVEANDSNRSKKED